MLSSKDYEVMKKAVEEHGDEFWQPTDVDVDHNIWLVEDVEEALAEDGYELVLRKKQ